MPVSGSSTLLTLLGPYQLLPVENPWHKGTITPLEESDEPHLKWTNRAGVSWELIPDLERGVLVTGEDNPYYDSWSL